MNVYTTFIYIYIYKLFKNINYVYNIKYYYYDKSY